MKLQEKQKAIVLRKKGVSMGEIAERLGVAKSSVSYWVRDIPLSARQRDKLNRNGHSVDAIEKRRIARIARTKRQREAIMEAAAKEVPRLSQDTLWCVGVALYWGEGGKTQQTARFANSDPAVIKTIVRFFRKSCSVPEEKLHGHVHTFSHKNAKEAERYWSKVSGIPVSRFYKTYVKQSSASINKRNTLPYGTFQVYVHDTTLFFQIKGWIKKLEELGE